MDAAGNPAGTAPDPVSEVAAATARPAPAAQPQASGPAYTTYDQNTGAFKDPAGGTGIFAAGANAPPALRIGWTSCLIQGRCSGF